MVLGMESWCCTYKQTACPLGAVPIFAPQRRCFLPSPTPGQSRKAARRGGERGGGGEAAEAEAAAQADELLLGCL